jgi:hypothetical protein
MYDPALVTRGRYRRPGEEALMERARLIAELAEVGSMKALLERHPSLTRDELTSILDHAARLLAEADGPGRTQLSPLYRVYNGFLLGMFTAGAIVLEVRGETERAAAAVHRVSEFLLEVCNEFGTEPDFGDPADLESAILEQLRSLDDELADYYTLGLATFRCVVLGDAALPDDEPEALRLLHQLGHPPRLFTAMLAEARTPEDEGEPTWQDMITTCIGLAREMVAGLVEEPDTCFVALPFRAPYEQRYLNFYRGAAARMGQRAIRAWGGLGQEEHQELLLALISRSGALLADVTEPNVNVTLEVGFALGQNKTVFLVAEQERWTNTANIQLDWVFPYRVNGDEPEPGEMERAGLYFTTLKALRRPGPIPSWSARPLDVLQQLTRIFDAAQPASAAALT